MMRASVFVALLMLVVSACGGGESSPVAGPTTAAADSTTIPSTTRPSITTAAPSTTTRPSTTTTSLPPVTGDDPSPRVIAFYYPWYGSDEFGGRWEHWGDMGNDPAVDVTSDYYPLLGPYSAYDPAVVAQHMAWMREAGVGAVAVSWWGRGTFEDGAVPVVLDAAERYGVRVAFHIEPYSGRTATRLVADIGYILERYGDHPAFYRTTDTSRWNGDSSPKGLFFMWNSGHPDNESPAVEASYWREALDTVHEMGAVVIADIPDGTWVDGGHFDGLYNYATLDTAPDFAWARTLPPDAWYVPSVLPGFFAVRIGYPASDFVPRADGATYAAQWAGALGTGIEPHLVTVTTFNEWHEGTQIEPAEQGRMRGTAGAYADYGALGPTGYLDLTAGHVAEFLAAGFPEPSALRIRLDVTTTSDWTTLLLVSGGRVARPEVVALDDTATVGWEGERLALFQPLGDAEQGHAVALRVDLEVLEPGDELVFRIERGGLGATGVEVSPAAGGAPAASVSWSGNNNDLADGEAGRNPYTFTVAVSQLRNG